MDWESAGSARARPIPCEPLHSRCTPGGGELGGMLSPVPKNISAGVCPANAECGMTVLCCSTKYATRLRTDAMESRVLR